MWTPERVGDALVAEMRAMYGGATILSRRGRTGQPVLDATAEALGERTAWRKELLSWANCCARECSFSERCREFGWSRSTVERHIAAAKQLVADHLNEQEAWRKVG